MAANPQGGTRLRSKKHKPIKGDDIISFFQQLSTLLTAGTPLLRSLQVAGEQSESEKLIAVLRALAAQVAGGATLNESMQKHPKLFDYQWIEMIKAGERSGRLAETIEELTAYIKVRRAIRGKVVSAMIYPSIMVLVLIGSLIIMLGKVVPTFAEFLEDFGSGLPAITQAVINASEFVQSHAPHLVLGPIVVGVALRYYFRTEGGGRRKEALLIKTPLLGQLSVESTMERFSHNLALLLKSGTPLLEALRIMPELFQSQGVYRPAFAWVYDSVGKGTGLAVSLERTGLFTPLLVNMIRVGEESGTLIPVLEEVATFYRAKVEVLVTRVTGMMEPIIVIFMGVSVGTILLSIYLPMFQMAGGPG
jgi:type IV pilus assembly protein PilC